MAIDPNQVPRFAHGSRVPGWDEGADLTKDPAVVPDPASTPVPDHVRADIEAAMARYPDVRSAAIPALHIVQREHGWCSPTAIEQAACVMRLTPAYLTALATFYDMFSTTPVPAELQAEIEQYMARYPDFRSAAIPALHAAQRVHGWCSPTAIEQAACVMRLTPAYLAALATFYDMYSTTPKGRHDVYVCTNISCSLRGADELYAEMLAVAGSDPDFHVKAFECLGACDIAPMASVDGEYVGPLEAEDCARLVDDVKAGRDVLPDKQLKKHKIAIEHWKGA